MIKYTTHTEENVPEATKPAIIIRLEEGKFEGTLFHYGSVVFPPEDKLKDDEPVQMTFEYNVVKPCDGYDIDDLELDKEFQTVIGDLLVELIEKEFADK